MYKRRKKIRILKDAYIISPIIFNVQGVPTGFTQSKTSRVYRDDRIWFFFSSTFTGLKMFILHWVSEYCCFTKNIQTLTNYFISFLKFENINVIGLIILKMLTIQF